MPFLDLPERSAKPRETGLTHVLDRGLSLAEVDGLVEVAGQAVDFVKLGWGTALATGNLEAKLTRYREHGIPVVCGGTLTELAIAQGRVEEMVGWLAGLGFAPRRGLRRDDRARPRRKLALIERLAARLHVFSEVGSKDAERIMAPYRWVEQISLRARGGRVEGHRRGARIGDRRASIATTARSAWG